jgi:hypothetical protein
MNQFRPPEGSEYWTGFDFRGLKKPGEDEGEETEDSSTPDLGSLPLHSSGLRGRAVTTRSRSRRL